MTLTRITGRSLAATPFAVVLAFAAMACACNVPVFRFALERWSPDVYRVTVLHRGPLSDMQRDLLRPLEDSQTNKLANIAVRTLDLNELGKQEDAATTGWLWDQDWSGLKAGEALLVVQYPEHLR